MDIFKWASKRPLCMGVIVNLAPKMSISRCSGVLYDKYVSYTLYRMYTATIFVTICVIIRSSLLETVDPVNLTCPC